MKFFIYNFMKARCEEEIIRGTELITRETKRYDREEDMMVFLLVPATALSAVSKKSGPQVCQNWCAGHVSP